MNTTLHKALLQVVPEIYCKQDLKNHTTFNIGGPADFIAVVKSINQIIDIIKLCQTASMPYKLLGGGSNVLISDNGFRGVVIINKADYWQISSKKINSLKIPGQTSPRLTTFGKEFYTTDGLDYVDPQDKRVLVSVAAGTRMIPFIKALFQKKITGLQWWSGIPASVGGAIFMNMHGGKEFFGDLVHNALIFDGENTKIVDHNYFDFGYDWCKLHQTGEIILEADLLLYYGDVDKAKELSVNWARRKSLQPQKSAGCVFQNLSAEQQKVLTVPTSSIGYLIDKVLKLKGTKKGDAIISNKHAAFIENMGHAKAKDVYYLYQLIKTKAKDQLGLELKSEIEFIGDF